MPIRYNGSNKTVTSCYKTKQGNNTILVKVKLQRFLMLYRNY